MVTGKPMGAGLPLAATAGSRAVVEGFRAQTRYFNTFASTYASLSGVFAAMFFVYLAALVLILGGEVNRVLEVRRIMRIERSREDAEV